MRLKYVESLDKHTIHRNRNRVQKNVKLTVFAKSAEHYVKYYIYFECYLGNGIDFKMGSQIFRRGRVFSVLVANSPSEIP